jgi:ribose 5-phosphate isomerase RpiB
MSSDTCKDEAERGITIKSTGISMFFEYDIKAGEVVGLSEEEAAAAAKAVVDRSNNSHPIQFGGFISSMATTISGLQSSSKHWSSRRCDPKPHE